MFENIDKRDALIPGLLMLLAVVIYVYIFDSKLDVIWDNWIYYVLGESLADGRGYVDLSGNPHTHFPPGYPAIISLVMIFSRSIILIKAFNGELFIAAIPVLYHIFKLMKVEKTTNIIVIMAVILNIYLLKMATVMMSEIPFLFFSLLTILLLMKIDLSGKIFKSPFLYVMLVCLVISIYIRTLGISLVPAVMVHFLVNKKWNGSKKTALRKRSYAPRSRNIFI